MKAITQTAAATLALTLGLAACVPASAPPPAPTQPVATRPAPRPAPAPLPPVVQAVPADQWMNAPATQGDWTQGLIAGVPFALFGTDSRIPALGLRCLRANGTITVARRSDSPSPQSMTIRSETMSRSLIAEPVEGFPGRFLGVSLRADDPLLDAMALSKGRFAVEVDGAPPLYVPSYAEVSRVIEDCRG